MAATLLGPIDWGGTIDNEGFTDYKVTYRVKCLPTDGPATVLSCPGLPVPGSSYAVMGDSNIWAFCKPDRTATPQNSEDKNTFWKVEVTFTTGWTKKCASALVTNPLLEPMEISGSSNKYTEEITRDRHGSKILTSSHEQPRGPQMEFDKNRPQVSVKQNVPDLQVALWAPMIDTVNDAPLWGMQKRCVKLSSVRWERKYYGACSIYYTRNFEFDIRAETFDREIMDEGTKVLNGRWVGGTWELRNVGGVPPDPGTPAHFIRFKDRQGNYARVILDGHGKPYLNKQDGLIEDVTATGPDTVLIASTDHSLTVGEFVIVGGVLGIEGANGLHEVVAVPTASTFAMDVIDPSGTYTAGGSWSRALDDGPGVVDISYYTESNFLLLGIPSIL
jgi:hypothetical protein